MTYPYGLIGNCQVAALVNENGSIDWLCLPRPDSPPIFGRLLDEEGGFFSINSLAPSVGKQSYLPNTNILITDVETSDGDRYRITDFCPRFMQHGRVFRPAALFRIVEPLKGSPSIRICCRPVDGWEKETVKPIRGNSHLRFDIRNDYMRLVTNMSLTYLADESPFALQEPLYFGLTWSYGIEEDLPKVARLFLEQTIDYWQLWVKHCSIPTLYQQQTIRSALTLKLHCYEDTGAILAALTTSLPEVIGGERNWDYRFCWLRDAYFVLTAFHNLGHFEEMEGFLRFLLNLGVKNDGMREPLRPVYRLDRTAPVPEVEHRNWRGYKASPPVRSENQAANHVQNDVYGEMILTLAPIFLDERFHHLRTNEHAHLLGHLVNECVQSISKADAGLWEIRKGWREHTFSNLMCWAGIDRIINVKERGFLPHVTLDLKKSRALAMAAVKKAVHDEVLRNGPNDVSFDAALLQLPILRYPDRQLCLQTVRSIRDNLQLPSAQSKAAFLYRYVRQDDFGTPNAAFVICSFWLVQALAKLGEIDEANHVMQEAISCGNSLGLFSEHYIPTLHMQTGNFPQAYSHVGQINAAFSVSPPWGDVL